MVNILESLKLKAEEITQYLLPAKSIKFVEWLKRIIQRRGSKKRISIGLGFDFFSVIKHYLRPEDLHTFGP